MDEQNDTARREGEVDETSPLLAPSSPQPSRRDAKKERGSAKTPLKEWLREVSIPTYALVAILSTMPMLTGFGVMVEAPQLVAILPEGWALPSYISLTQQAGKVLSLLVTAAVSCISCDSKDVSIIYMAALLTLSCYVLLAIFWEETSLIAGAQHSTALIVLLSFIFLADSTCSIFCLGFMANFKAQYMSSFYLGLHCSGLVASVLGFIQGVPEQPSPICNGSDTDSVVDPDPTGNAVSVEEPRFSVSVYFVLLACLDVLSITAFTLINFLPVFLKDRTSANKASTESVETSEEEAIQQKDAGKGFSKPDKQTKPNVVSSDTSEPVAEKPVANVAADKVTVEMVILIALFAGSAAILAIVLPLLSYACMPYGANIFGIAVNTKLAVKPLAPVTVLFTPNITTRVLVGITLPGLLSAAYVVFVAAKSPHPPLQGQTMGEILVVSLFC